MGVDPAVIVFTTLVALASTTAFGLLPVWKISRNAPVDLLRDGARRTGPGVAARNTRRALVAVECALAVMLVAGAGLLVRSLAESPGCGHRILPTGALMVSRGAAAGLTQKPRSSGAGAVTERMLGRSSSACALAWRDERARDGRLRFDEEPGLGHHAETDRGRSESSAALTSPPDATPGVFS